MFIHTVKAQKCHLATINHTINLATLFRSGGRNLATKMDGTMPARKSTSNKYCFVPGCYSKTKTGEISLHLFPKDKHLRKQWKIRLRIRKKS